MSALAQKQTFDDVRRMSALPPKADMDQHGRDVRFVHKRNHALQQQGLLFNHQCRVARHDGRRSDIWFMNLSCSNRKKVNCTTDECPDDRTVNADVLKVAAED
jgi:hypothetical protein